VISPTRKKPVETPVAGTSFALATPPGAGTPQAGQGSHLAWHARTGEELKDDPGGEEEEEEEEGGGEGAGPEGPAAPKPPTLRGHHLIIMSM